MRTRNFCLKGKKWRCHHELSGILFPKGRCLAPELRTVIVENANAERPSDLPDRLLPTSAPSRTIRERGFLEREPAQ